MPLKHAHVVDVTSFVPCSDGGDAISGLIASLVKKPDLLEFRDLVVTPGVEYFVDPRCGPSRHPVATE